MTALDDCVRIKVDGYDLALERGRYRFPSVVANGVALNRGTTRLGPAAPGAAREGEGVTCAGHFVHTAAGTYLDAALGGARKLLDAQHPTLQRGSGAAVRGREELARLWTGLAARSFPDGGGYRARFTGSGGASLEAALALADRVAGERLRRRHGAAEAELRRQLGPAPLPVCIVQGPERARHASAGRPVVEVPFNGQPGDLEEVLDPAPLEEVLRGPGGVRAVLDRGRVPPDLVAAFVVEAFQADGDCRLGRAAWLQGIHATCRRHGIVFVADEVLTFGRTGTPFALEQLGIAPDVIALGRCTVQAMALARAAFEDALPPAAGEAVKDADVDRGYAVVDTYLHYPDPVFEGRTSVENSRIKGEYLRSNLAWLRERHPEWLLDFGGLGGMFSMAVKERDRVAQSAWKHGLKLEACGAESGTEGRLRIVLLADVLTREIDVLTGALDAAFTDLSGE